jgi:hypothetical protein
MLAIVRLPQLADTTPPEHLVELVHAPLSAGGKPPRIGEDARLTK